MADREVLLNQADTFWKMLDDLADTDPEAYKVFMDRTLKEGSGYFKPPEPCFCISTVVLPSVVTHQVFVNICSWEQVPAPKSENDPIPVMAGELQEQVEEESTYTVVDIIFNPLVTKGVENSKDRKNLLIHVALDYLENTTSIQVTRKYKNLRIKFKGDPKQLLEYLKHRDEQGIKPHEPRQDTAGVSETPESLLIQLSSIGVSDMKSEKNPTVSLFETTNKPKKNLIEEISTTNSRDLPVSPNYVIEVKEATNTKPRRVLVKVDVPDVESSSQCQLHASMMEVSLDVPGMYKLHAKLPEKVDKEQTTAYFNTITHRLIVNLPTWT